MSDYTFRLFVAGRGSRSLAAESNLRRMCDTRLTGRYEIEVIDVVEQPERAAEERIMATPTVVRTAPAPQLRVIGDLTEIGRAAAYLGLPDSAQPPEERRAR